MSGDIVIIGASRGPGRQLFDHLIKHNHSVVGIARNPRGLATSPSGRFVQCDASDTEQLAMLIGQNNTVINASRPEFLTNLLELDPPISRLIALGSTRIYTRFADEKCDRLAAMAHAIWMRDIPATILHATMIYGSQGLNNIERICKIARLSPLIPLPENGSALIQPVHVNDVVASIDAILKNPQTIGQTLIIAGQDPVTYREFIEACIELSGHRCKVLSLPYSVVSIIGLLTHLVPGIPSITQDEIRRLREDKNFDVTEVEDSLGVKPSSLREGLQQIFS